MSFKTKYENLLRRLETNTLEWIGLDIGSASVKSVRGRWHNHQFTVTGAGLIELNETDGPEEQKERQIILAVQTCLQRAGMKIPCTVCAHSGPEVLIRPFQFPALPPEALGQAIRLEAQQMSPFEPDQSIVEYQTMPRPEDDCQAGYQGYLVVAMRDAVERKVEWVKAAGGRVLLMDVEGLAALNVLQTGLPEPADGLQALIHIGNRFTTVSILGENGIPFIRDLTYAGKNISTAVRRQTGLSDREIRSALFGNDSAETLPEAIRTALKNASTRSISDINETLRYYLTQHSGSRLTQIYLTGGWALSRPFTDLLAGALPVNVNVWNPFETLPVQAPPAQQALIKRSGPALTVALGLAMRTLP